MLQIRHYRLSLLEEQPGAGICASSPVTFYFLCSVGVAPRLYRNDRVSGRLTAAPRIAAGSAAVTLKVTELLVPPGVLTVTLLVAIVAALAIANVALTVVSFTTVTPDTVIPAPAFTVVAPVKAAPVRVTLTLAPRAPEVGLMLDRDGGASTVKGTVLVGPLGVVTLTFLVDGVAFAATMNKAVAVLSFVTLNRITVTPLPTPFSPVAPVRPEPFRVTWKRLPRAAEAGVIDVNVAGTVTLKLTVLVVAPGTLTLTVLAPVVAVPAIPNVAVTVVSFTAVNAVTVIPVPDTFKDVAPVRPAPVNVTGTLVPRSPAFGLIDESTSLVTVKVTVLLVPPGVVTLTVLDVAPAFPAIVNVAVIVVSFTTFIPLTVTPVPDTLIAEASLRPVPESVTATTVP
jgi:hypothetical protein